MNKIIKYWQLCIMAVLSVAFTACTEEYEYDPTTDTTGYGAYMDASTQTSIILKEDDPQQLSFTVLRHDTTSAATYKLYTDYEDIDIPESVSFNAGEKSKTITATFNVPSGTVQKQVVIGIAGEDAYTYGANSLTFIISRLKKVSGAMFYESGLFFQRATWEVSVYENGFTRNADGTTSASYLIVEPYANEEIASAIGLTENDTKGYNLKFSLSNDGKATLKSGSSLFYITANVTGDPSIVGDAIPSGDGTYYKDETQLSSGDTFSNFVLFPWNIAIGKTGYGFTSVSLEAVIFPEGYDPLTQTQITE